MRRLLPVALLLALLPTAAQAHLVTTGFGSFYDGIVHLLITPTDMLLLLGVGLFAGQQGREPARRLLMALPLCWLLAGLLGSLRSAGAADFPVLTILSCGVFGLLVVLDRRLPQVLTLGLACLAVGLHGYVNGATIADVGMDRLAIWGAALCVFVLATLLPALVLSLRLDWMRIGVRVAGSWITAISLLLLGWLWHTARG